MRELTIAAFMIWLSMLAFASEVESSYASKVAPGGAPISEHLYLVGKWITPAGRQLVITNTGNVTIRDSAGTRLDEGHISVRFSTDMDKTGFVTALVLHLQLTTVSCSIVGYFRIGEGDPSGLSLLMPGMMPGYTLGRLLGADSPTSAVNFERPVEP